MAEAKAPLSKPGDGMKMKKDDIIFGIVAIVAIIALVLYMN